MHPARVEAELPQLARALFGDDDKIRALFHAPATADLLGIPVHQEGESIHYSYPVAVLVADRS